MVLRAIKPEEKALIEHLLQLANQTDRYSIPEQVADMNDGGMGGVQLSSRGEHKDDLVEADCEDSDRCDVFISLTTNQYDELFELDIWREDFATLKRYPEPDNVQLADSTDMFE